MPKPRCRAKLRTGGCEASGSDPAAQVPLQGRRTVPFTSFSVVAARLGPSELPALSAEVL